MKTFKLSLLVFLLSFFTTISRSAEIENKPDGTYSVKVSIHQQEFVYDRAKKEVYEAANSFCGKNNKSVKTIKEEKARDFWSQYFPKYQLDFSCILKGYTSDEIISTKACYSNNPNINTCDADAKNQLPAGQSAKLLAFNSDNKMRVMTFYSNKDPEMANQDYTDTYELYVPPGQGNMFHIIQGECDTRFTLGLNGRLLVFVNPRTGGPRGKCDLAVQKMNSVMSQEDWFQVLSETKTTETIPVK